MAIYTDLNDKDKPLVSILVFNYNYGRYLRECLQSVYDQTYQNIEICFSDNASTDESWDIALEFARRYPGTMTITRNRKNFGSDANYANCALNCRGKYYIQLCSDDALMPECVEKCVQVLELHMDAGFAMVHRTVINENGALIEEPPFYNCSCLIPGDAQAAVYMMAAVNPSISQVMYNKRKAYGKGTVGSLAALWYGNRIQDYNMCCEFPMVYFKEPLMLHRVHSQSHSSSAVDNLLEVIGPYVLRYQFAETANQLGLKNVADRLAPSVERLAHLSLRYCLRLLTKNDERGASRYLHLAAAIMPEITSDPTYKKLQAWWASSSAGRNEILETLVAIDNLSTRSVSYDPPPGSNPIYSNGQLISGSNAA